MHKYYVIENNMPGWDHVGLMADIASKMYEGATRRQADALAKSNAEFQSQFTAGVCYLVIQVAKNWAFGRVVAQFNA